MDAQEEKKKPGKTPISDDLWNQILDLKKDGKKVPEIMQATGLKQTKVYEVLRSGTRK